MKLKRDYMFIFVYLTKNIINNKSYIGWHATNNINDKYIGSGLLLRSDIQKYGHENFITNIIEFCNKDNILEKEIFWIKEKNSLVPNGYNIAYGGEGDRLRENDVKKGKTYEEYYGTLRAQEIKQKFSQKRKGREKPFKNITAQDVGKKISISLKSKQMKRTNKTKSQISKSLKKYYNSDRGILARKNISKNNANRTQTIESNEKRSKAMKGCHPKPLEIHPSAKYWYFYDKNNKLILETLGHKKEALKKLKTNQRHLVIFNNLEECLKYTLTNKKEYKVFSKKFYNKKITKIVDYEKQYYL